MLIILIQSANTNVISQGMLDTSWPLYQVWTKRAKKANHIVEAVKQLSDYVTVDVRSYDATSVELSPSPAKGSSRLGGWDGGNYI